METNPFRAGRPDPGGGSDAEEGAGARSGDGPGPSPPPRPGWWRRAHRWLEASVRGGTWWYRLPVVLVLGWIFRGYLADPGGGSIFHGITLGFHEMGHAFFSWFGVRLLTAAGGTIFQLAAPLAAAGYLLWRQRDPFGATVGTFWLGTSLVDAGVYAADARAQELPLVSPFGPVDPGSHDWTTILMRFGMLSRDQAIGGGLQDAGVAVMAVSLAAGVWVLWLMARSREAADRVEDRIRGPRRRAGGADEEERLRAFLDRESGGADDAPDQESGGER